MVSELEQRWQAQMSRPHVIVSELREIGNGMAAELTRLRAEVERLTEVDRLREVAFNAYAEQERKDREQIEQLKLERDHWHSLVPRADRVQFPLPPTAS